MLVPLSLFAIMAVMIFALWLERGPDKYETVGLYIDGELKGGESLSYITRHMLGLFAGMPGARAWRRHISDHAHREGAGPEVLVDALNAMPVAA